MPQVMPTQGGVVAQVAFIPRVTLVCLQVPPPAMPLPILVGAVAQADITVLVTLALLPHRIAVMHFSTEVGVVPAAIIHRVKVAFQTKLATCSDALI